MTLEDESKCIHFIRVYAFQSFSNFICLLSQYLQWLDKTEPEASPTKTAPETVPVDVTSTTSDPVPSSLESKNSPPIKTKRSFDEISSSASTVEDDVNSPQVNKDDVPDVMISEEETAEKPKSPSAPVTFKVVYAKKPYEVTLDLSCSIADLKTELYNQTGVMASMQKLCFRGYLLVLLSKIFFETILTFVLFLTGNLEDKKTLEESGIKTGVKIMMIGSKMDDIKTIDEGKPESSSKTLSKEKVTKEPLCQQKVCSSY